MVADVDVDHAVGGCEENNNTMHNDQLRHGGKRMTLRRYNMGMLAIATMMAGAHFEIASSIDLARCTRCLRGKPSRATLKATR